MKTVDFGRAALGDERGFVHKRILRGVKGFLTGGPVGGLTGFLAPGRPTPTFAPAISKLEAQRQRHLAAGLTVGGCEIGWHMTPKGCVRDLARGARISEQRTTLAPPVGPVTRRDQLTLGGDAELGRFGAGVNPAFFSGQTRRCPRGMVLGAPEADGESLCYNKRDLSNKERMWPRGRRPLLTGGDMRCINIAAKAAGKLQAKQKQLEKMGMLKKPQRRAAPKLLAPGHHAHVAHD